MTGFSSVNPRSSLRFSRISLKTPTPRVAASQPTNLASPCTHLSAPATRRIHSTPGPKAYLRRLYSAALFECGEFQEWVEVAKDFADVGGETVAGCSGRCKFFADDPALEFRPVGCGWPAVVLRPIAFHRGIPIALVFIAQALFLPRKPLRICRDAWFGDQRDRRQSALGFGVNSEPHSHRVGGDSGVELPALHFARQRRGKLQIHLRAVGRFVFRET